MFYGLWKYFLLVVAVAHGSAGSAVNTTTNNCASRLKNLELEYETLKTGYSELSAIVRKLEREDKRQGIANCFEVHSYMTADVRFCTFGHFLTIFRIYIHRTN